MAPLHSKKTPAQLTTEHKPKADRHTAGSKSHYSSPEVQKPILDALKAYKEEHGHLRMSQLYTNPQGMKLGARLRTLRRSFKLGQLCDEFAQDEAGRETENFAQKLQARAVM